MGLRVSINTHVNICTEQTQRKRMLGEVYCGCEGGEEARQSQWVTNKNYEKKEKMARDEGNEREESMCLTRVTATCAA